MILGIHYGKYPEQILYMHFQYIHVSRSNMYQSVYYKRTQIKISPTFILSCALQWTQITLCYLDLIVN
jgi:hypothetical protein